MEAVRMLSGVPDRLAPESDREIKKQKKSFKTGLTNPGNMIYLTETVPESSLRDARNREYHTGVLIYDSGKTENC